MDVNSKCGNCIPAMNSGCLALFLNRGGIEINLFGLQLLLKLMSELSEMLLACSQPSMQEEQDEIPEKYHFVRNRLELGVCRYLEKRCTYDRKKGFSHQLGYNKAMGLLSAVSMRMQAN